MLLFFRAANLCSAICKSYGSRHAVLLGDRAVRGPRFAVETTEIVMGLLRRGSAAIRRRRGDAGDRDVDARRELLVPIGPAADSSAMIPVAILYQRLSPVPYKRLGSREER